MEELRRAGLLLSGQLHNAELSHAAVYNAWKLRADGRGSAASAQSTGCRYPPCTWSSRAQVNLAPPKLDGSLRVVQVVK